MADVDLLVFTAVGRTAVLERTLRGLAVVGATEQFARRVLSMDGTDSALLSQAQSGFFTDMVASRDPRGYFSNICQGIANVHTPFFFWCEDDFEFTHIPEPHEALELFERYPHLAQVRIPRETELMLEHKRLGHLAPGVWGQDTYYSFCPHYGRTDLMRRAIDEGLGAQAAGQNVEVAFSNWMRRHGHIFGAWDPSVARAYHFGKEVIGPATDYAKHLVPKTSPVPGTPILRSGTVETKRVAADMCVTPETGGPSRVLRLRIFEFSIKVLFAFFAVLRAVLTLPYDRQSRAFLRTIWWYWHPELDNPSYLGPTMLDEAEPASVIGRTSNSGKK